MAYVTASILYLKKHCSPRCRYGGATSSAGASRGAVVVSSAYTHGGMLDSRSGVPPPDVAAAAAAGGPPGGTLATLMTAEPDDAAGGGGGWGGGAAGGAGGWAGGEEAHDEAVRFAQLVDDAHTFASRALLELFNRDRALLRRLRVVKAYLLLAQGDFYVNLMDLAEVWRNATHCYDTMRCV